MSSLHSYSRDTTGLAFLPTAAGATLPPNAGVGSGIVGSWAFEDQLAQDSSPYANRMSICPPSGPGFLRGNSGRFDGLTAYSVKHIDAYETKEQSICAWVFLLTDVRDSFRVIFDKGNGAVSLRVWPDTRTLRVSVNGKHGDSRSSLPLNRWTHVCLSLGFSNAQLFINGIADVAVAMAGSPWKDVKADYYIASIENRSLLGVNALIDNLEIRSKALLNSEAKALGSLAFWGIPGGADVAWFACEGCLRETAKKTCANPTSISDNTGVSRPKSHLCTERELTSSVLLLARTMGWINSRTTHVFDYENSSSLPDGTLGVGICCPDS